MVVEGFGGSWEPPWDLLAAPGAVLASLGRLLGRPGWSWVALGCSWAGPSGPWPALASSQGGAGSRSSESSEARTPFCLGLEWTRAFNAREVSWLRVSGFGLGGFERPFDTIFEVYHIRKTFCQLVGSSFEFYFACRSFGCLGLAWFGPP